MCVPPIAEPLLTWFVRCARVLPWRAEPTLYKTVVSEFMLQQTQVGTAIPYFEKWLKRFPHFGILAAADVTDVLHAWSGLGYYQRARRLHALAKIVSAWESEGNIPKDETSWKRLPGIGPYTAAAITSIAFGTPVAVVDGNVVRVLARLTADSSLFKNNTAATKHFAALAQKMLSQTFPGAHNEALMELGATVCTKAQPRCAECPLKSLCRAYALSSPTAYPRLARKITERVTVDRAFCADKKRVLLCRAPDTSKRLAGLYELPLLSALPTEIPRLVYQQTRSIAQQRIRERLYAVEAPSIVETPLLWVEWPNLHQIPLSGPHRKWLKTLKLREDLF